MIFKNAWEKAVDTFFIFLSPIIGIIILLMALSALGKEMHRDTEPDDP
jgi:predicted membrane protein